MTGTIRTTIGTLSLFLAIPMCGFAAEPAQPLIVAHRGLLKHAPENTLANFRACLELRIGFEFDVERTKDGHLVCIHDSTVDRTTDGTGKVSELTLAQVRDLDAGSWFAPAFAGEKVPTVDDVLQLVAEFRQQNVLIAVDLKAENVGQEVVRLAEQHEVLHRLLFIGRTIAEPKLREQIRGASANAHTAAVANNAGEFSASLAAPNADWVYVRFLPTADQIKSVHQAGKKAFIAGSTVAGNLPQNWQHCAAVGLDAILTDYAPDLRQMQRGDAAQAAGGEDLARVQGKWVRTVRTDRGRFKILKEHKGNKTTLTVLDSRGRVVEQKNSEFRLENTGNVRIFTFFNNVFTSGPNKGRTDNASQSYAYRVSGDTFIEFRGLLNGDNERPLVFTWERVTR